MAIERTDHVGGVVDDLEAATACRLCDGRGPEGTIVALAEQLR